MSLVNWSLLYLATEYHITSWYQQARLGQKMVVSIQVGDWPLDVFEWVGSRENTMKLYPFDGLTQVGYDTQKSTASCTCRCGMLNICTLPVYPVLFSSLPLPPLLLPKLLFETVGNLLKHCPTGPSNSSEPCWKQLTR